jgi:hypothetical protein
MIACGKRCVKFSRRQRETGWRLGEDKPAVTRRDIAFHLTDWLSDAAFLVAFALHPERFTDEEVNEGIGLFLCHAPEHAAAAAEAYGYPVCGVFSEGAADSEVGPA